MGAMSAELRPNRVRLHAAGSSPFSAPFLSPFLSCPRSRLLSNLRPSGKVPAAGERSRPQAQLPTVESMARISQRTALSCSAHDLTHGARHAVHVPLPAAPEPGHDRQTRRPCAAAAGWPHPCSAQSCAGCKAIQIGGHLQTGRGSSAGSAGRGWRDHAAAPPAPALTLCRPAWGWHRCPPG